MTESTTTTRKRFIEAAGRLLDMARPEEMPVLVKRGRRQIYICPSCGREHKHILSIKHPVACPYVQHWRAVKWLRNLIENHSTENL